MIFHLGMSGRWRIDPRRTRPARPSAARDGCRARRSRCNDPRRFGSVDLVPTDALADLAAVRGAGPGAARARTSPPTYLLAAARRPQRADQGDAARPANRRRARQHLCLRGAPPRAASRPAATAGAFHRRPARTVGAGDHAVLLAAIEAGGSSLRDYARPDGELGYFSKQLRGVWAGRGAVPVCGTPNSPAGRLGAVALSSARVASVPDG